MIQINQRGPIWQWGGVAIVATAVASAVLALRFTGVLQASEWAMLDQFFRWRPPERVDDRILIVSVDEADIRYVKQWSASDATIAALLNKIKAGKPKAIGLDLYRDLTVPPGTKALEDVFRSTPNLIGIEKKVADRRSAPVAPPPVLSQLGQVSSNDVVLDTDGKLRRGLLFLTPDSEDAIPSLGLSLAQIYLADYGIVPTAAADGAMQLGNTVFRPFEANDGGYIRADAASYQILLNYRSAPFDRVSLTDVLENRVPSERVRDRVVLIGAVARSLNDFFYTPFSSTLVGYPEQTAGVEVQAHLASSILSSVLDQRPLLQTVSDPLEIIWIVLWSAVGASVIWAVRSDKAQSTTYLRSILGLLVVATGLLSGAYALFLASWWIPVVPPLLVLVGSATVMTGYIAQLERSDRKTVMTLFGRHVAPEIAAVIWQERHQLLEAGRLPGQQMSATVLFADLRGFTAITEQTDPRTLMQWLNECMEAVAETVLAHGGIVDKFIGDAVMAVFGVPIPRTTADAIAQDANAAVRCAVAIAATLERLNQTWQQQGRPIASMRIGIATGPVITGSLGSSQRLDYTTIGDSVNVAARLESYNESMDGTVCRILISQETYRYVQEQFPTRFVDTVHLRGRQ
ncbi:adenylate/guanylate cyclase domain-containing protein, partial [Leptolyngbya sp. FACHB-36]|uniref:CHASE2 domain-containing protein n=1 Tax=Leptolyngbya sp. FACHB-36 TaxID=2692808 RepID=UPI001680F72B